MSDLRKTISKFVWTKGEWLWSEKLRRYVLLSKEGYEYDGAWALAHNVSPIWDADDYQFFDDDAGIGSATSLAAVNTAYSPAPGDQIRLRVNVAETNGAAGTGEHTAGWTLQYAVDGGSFTTVGAATNVRYFDSTNLTNGTSIAFANYALPAMPSGVQRDWGDECEDGVSSGHSGNVWSSDQCEIEYTIDLFNVSDGEEITFQMLAPDGTSAVTFENIPTLNVTAGATINNVTSPGSNNYAATTDNVLVRRERSRQRQDSAVISDPTDQAERQRFREQVESTDLSYSAETMRRRTVEILNNVVALADSAIAVKSEAPAAATLTDSITATDQLIALRERLRELSDAIAATDDAVELRERYREVSDSVDVVDAEDWFRLADRATADSVTATDDAIELRERFRILTDSIDVTDLALIPEIGTILFDAIEMIDSATMLRSRFLVLSDTIDVTDLALIPEIGTLLIDTIDAVDNHIELRQRFRLLADAITITDNAIPTYVPVGSDIYDVTLTDLLSVADALSALRERFRVFADSVTAVDSNIELRERNRTQSDSVTATDDAIELRERSRSILDTLAAADNNIELRERNRVLADSIDVIDSILITVAGTISRTLSDSVTATDSSQQIRYRVNPNKNDKDVVMVGNLVPASDDLTDSTFWEDFGGVTVTSGIADPDGGNNAFRLTMTGTQGLRTLTNYRPGFLDDLKQMGFKARRESGSGQVFHYVMFQNNATQFQATIDASPGDWFDVSYEQSSHNQTLAGQFGWLTIGAAGTEVIDVYQPRANFGDQLSAYTSQNWAGALDTLLPSRLRSKSLLDSLTTADVAEFLRSRARLFTDNPLITDNIIATIVREGGNINLRTLMDQLSVVDLTDAEKIQVLTQFIIKHGIETLSVDHGVERFHILNKVRRIT
jgi:hypothetical protein